jgi:CheY-like chemotaxis protein
MNPSLKILIVEDEALAVITLEHILKSWGYTLCPSVSSGEDALEMVKQQHPDIVLMDIGLAGNLDGLEAARQISALSPAKIVFITGYADPGIQAQASQLNPLAYLLKPINFDRLKSAIALDYPG